ncbi:septum site-determining protein Ssd [Desertihabitans brevis]|nr:septum site-determining protein Ssd [Desertihabitans brevis]
MATTTAVSPGPSTAPAGPAVALVTGQERLASGVLAAAAAAGVEVWRVRSAEELRPAWTSATQVYLGIDVAESVQAAALARRDGVHLVAAETDGDLSRWSCAFDACVVTLPDTAGVLMSRLVGAVGGGAPGEQVVTVTGATGGAGASTLVVALAAAVAAGGGSVLAVDLDVDGGGLDLAAGLERAVGWRWPDLAAASGQVGDLRGQLPEADGVGVLSMARPAADPPPLPAVASVLASGRRWWDVCLVDCPRGAGAVTEEALTAATRRWVVVRAEVRALAAARALVARTSRRTGPVEVVGVAAAGAGIGVEALERTVGAPVLAVLPDDARLRQAVARGGAVAQAGSRRWRRGVHALAAELVR